jgi:hypothetical protein
MEDMFVPNSKSAAPEPRIGALIEPCGLPQK